MPEINEPAYLEALVKPLVKFPDQVRVERTTDERGVLLTLFLAQEDMGIIIGKEGQTAKSIRVLLRGLGARNQRFLSMKIYEPMREGFERRIEPVREARHIDEFDTL